MSTLNKIQEVIDKSEEGADKLIELNLSQIKIQNFTPEIKKAIEKCKNLQILILAGCSLKSLDNMPESDLTAIDLSQNQLQDSELSKLARYANLGQLILNENSFSKLESIKYFSSLQNLQQLDLSENPITSVQNYRQFVLQNLPKLQILDRFDREGNQQIEQDQFQDDEEDEDGQQSDDDQDEDDQQIDDEQEQSPQPTKKR